MSTNEPRPPFYDKLSRAAQNWINFSNARIEDLTERLALAQGEVDPTGETEVRAGLGGYSLTRDLVPLPPHTEIEFTSGKGRDGRLLFRMPTTRDVGWVEVTSEHGILVRPAASNVVLLRPTLWSE